jgi:hypothetical protein
LIINEKNVIPIRLTTENNRDRKDPAMSFPIKMSILFIGRTSNDSIVFFSLSPAKEVVTYEAGAIIANITDRKVIIPIIEDVSASPSNVTSSIFVEVIFS